MHKRIGSKIVFAIMLLVIFCGSGYILSKTAFANTASGTSVNYVVNYQEETITVASGTGGSNKFYLSTDKQKTWELLENSTTVSSTITFDISNILKTKEVIIYFKGNKDTQPVEVTLQGEDKSLKVTYIVENSVGKLTYTTTKPVEYRKGANGNWKTLTGNLDTTIYEVRGANLYFRTKATVTDRAGKVVKVKIPKRGSAPGVKVDGTELTLTGMKTGMQYRLSNSNTWLTFQETDKKEISIPSLLRITSIDVPVTGVTIEVRNAATDKKVASQIKVIDVPAQLAAPTSATVAFNTGTLTIQDASSSKPYEYTIVKAGEVSIVNFDYLKNATWKSVTSSKATKVTKVGNNTLATGDYIYVRLKTTTDKTTKVVNLASTCLKIGVTSIN